MNEETNKHGNIFIKNRETRIKRLNKTSRPFRGSRKICIRKRLYNDVHRTIFCVIRSILLNGGKLDKALLAEKIKNLGVSFRDDIDIYSYVDNLAFSQIHRRRFWKQQKELLKLRIRREIQETAQEVKTYVEKAASKGIDEITKNVTIYITPRLIPTQDDTFIGLKTLKTWLKSAASNPTKIWASIPHTRNSIGLYGGL